MVRRINVQEFPKSTQVLAQLCPQHVYHLATWIGVTQKIPPSSKQSKAIDEVHHLKRRKEIIPSVDVKIEKTNSGLITSM